MKKFILFMIVILVGRVFASNTSNPPKPSYCRGVSCNCSPSHCKRYEECIRQ